MAQKTLKTVYAAEFQRTHFKKAVFPLFADTRFRDVLKEGATVSWDYDDDAVADELGSGDTYTIEEKTATAETLTVDKKPSHGFVIRGTEKIQQHGPTQEKWARKSMNVIMQKVDGDILKDLKAAANSSLSAGDFGGSSGDPITATSSNAAAIFAAAQRVLTNNNVIYDENKVFQNVVKLDGGERFPAAAIPAELKEQLLLQTGFKDTSEGDRVMKSGFMGAMFGFNAIASTSLPFSFRLTFTATPTDGSTLVIGSVTWTWETGALDTAGKVKAETDAATSVAHLVVALNAPYTAAASDHEELVRTSLTKAQRRIADNVSAVDNEDGSCVITVAGQGRVVVSQTDANGEIDREAVHAIFAVSKSIAVVMQRSPELAISAGDLITTSALAGVVGKHYLTWGLYGKKVFFTQKAGIVNVPIAASAFSAPASVVN